MTKKQQLLIELYATKPFAKDKDIAMEVGVTPQYICKFKRTDTFKEALDKRLKEIWKDSERIAVDAMIEAAKSGNITASTYILNSLNYQAPQQINLNTNVIKVSIEDD